MVVLFSFLDCTAANMEKQYDIALSYAAEDREQAEAIAGACQAIGLRVFFDKLVMDEIWGKDLLTHLQTVYRERALFVIPLVSKSYVEKYWTKVELEASLKTDVLRDSEYILPARLDDTALPSLGTSRASVNLKSLTPRELATLVSSKVEKFRREDARIQKILSCAWSNEGNVYPPDTHRLELDLATDGDVLTGTAKCWGDECYTGEASIQGERYNRKLDFSIVNIVRGEYVEFGKVFAELVEEFANTPTQIRWKLKTGLAEFLPQKTILYPSIPFDRTGAP
jgi:hypothetical protein